MPRLPIFAKSANTRPRFRWLWPLGILHPNSRRFGRRSGAFAGAEVAHASPGLAVELGIPSVGIRGVIVVSVEGRAARWLRPGDLIRIVDGKRIQTVADVVEAVRRSGERMSVAIERNGRRLTAEFGR